MYENFRFFSDNFYDNKNRFYDTKTILGQKPRNRNFRKSQPVGESDAPWIVGLAYKTGALAHRTVVLAHRHVTLAHKTAVSAHRIAVLAHRTAALAQRKEAHSLKTKNNIFPWNSMTF